ncbi:MAG: LysR family transcriptional regulator [Variovorax sp.]|nr:LysR family transcriptional regulator [Variovorax sp.]
MKLNLRQIEVFRAVMVSGSVSGASKLLFVSQPAVSRLVSYMEQRLGFELFERIKGRLYPTPEARRLFEEVANVYQGVQRVNDIAENLARNRIGQLRIACSPNIGQSVMPRAVSIFCASHPEVRIELHTLIPSGMLQGLLSQQVEFGVTYMPVVHPSLEVRPLYKNRIMAALPRGHRLASQKSVRVRDLAKEPFVGYSSDIPFGQLVRQIFGSEEQQPSTRIEVLQAHVACAMVQANVGVALVDELTLKGPVWANIEAVPITPVAYAPVNVFNVQLQPLSRVAKAFIEVLESLDM